MQADPLNWITLEAAMQSLGHSHLTVLKADIEGAEYDVLGFWSPNGSKLPQQVAVELHVEWLYHGEHWLLITHTAGRSSSRERGGYVNAYELSLTSASWRREKARTMYPMHAMQVLLLGRTRMTFRIYSGPCTMSRWLSWRFSWGTWQTWALAS